MRKSRKIRTTRNIRKATIPLGKNATCAKERSLDTNFHGDEYENDEWDEYINAKDTDGYEEEDDEELTQVHDADDDDDLMTSDDLPLELEDDFDEESDEEDDSDEESEDEELDFEDEDDLDDDDEDEDGDLCTMFVRKKKHRSGHIGVLVVDKKDQG